MKKNEFGWNKIYKDCGLSYVSNSSRWKKVIEFLKKKGVKSVLDVGCGTGIHLMELAKLNFKVIGIDGSTVAVRLARNTFKRKRLFGKFIVGNVHQRLPFKNDYFDAVISLRTINHGDFREIARAIDEIRRVLKENGIVFITVQKVIGFRGKLGQQILNNLKVDFIKSRIYIKLQGEEKGIKHFIMSKEILFKLFNKFRVIDFWVSCGKERWEKYYCLLATKKACI